MYSVVLKLPFFQEFIRVSDTGLEEPGRASSTSVHIIYSAKSFYESEDSTCRKEMLYYFSHKDSLPFFCFSAVDSAILVLSHSQIIEHNLCLVTLRFHLRKIGVLSFQFLFIDRPFFPLSM